MKSFFHQISFGTLILALFTIHKCDAKDWLISHLTSTITSNADSGATLKAIHTIGKDAHAVKATLYDVDCKNKVEDGDVVSLRNESFVPPEFRYNINVDYGKVASSDLVIFEDPSNKSVGTIKFCTRVVTILEPVGMEVTFRLTNFNLNFNLKAEFNMSFTGGRRLLSTETHSDYRELTRVGQLLTLFSHD